MQMTTARIGAAAVLAALPALVAADGRAQVPLRHRDVAHQYGLDYPMATGRHGEDGRTSSYGLGSP